MSQEVQVALVVGLLTVAAALVVPYISHGLKTRRAKASGLVLQHGRAAKNIEVIFPDGKKAVPQGDIFSIPDSAKGGELLVFTRPGESNTRRELMGIFLIPEAVSGIFRMELESLSNLKKDAVR